jgi:lycopene epsilon-cyclase
VGAGPAGLIVAAEMAERGVTVGLIAPDTPFVNNYGVWLEEFQAGAYTRSQFSST